MTKKIISFSVEHPVSVLSIVLGIFLLGIFCTFTMGSDLLPEISCRKLIVSAKYQGISPQDMKTLVTIPLEDAFISLKDLKRISSVTREGLSVLTLELHWGSDWEMALVECREIIDLCYRSLPSGCEKPVVQSDLGLGDTITVAMIPLDQDLMYARHIAQTDIKPRFQRLYGCSKVSVYGGETEQILVNGFYSNLEALGLSLLDLSSVLSRSNFEYPSGTLNNGNKEILVKTSGLFSSLQDIRDTPIYFNDKGLLRISDVAEVVKEAKEKDSFFMLQGKECIRIGITKKTDASPINLSRSVASEIKSLEKEYGEHYSFVVIEDLSEEVQDALISLLCSAGAGIFVTAIVIRCFLHKTSVAILLSSVIPISAFFSIIILRLFGTTINIMSLSGISVGIGMVVDAGTVVLENLASKNISYKSSDFKELVKEGIQEVSMSNIGSALTTIIVFLPIFFLNGLLGELFQDMAISIIASVFSSCILSLTFIPSVYILGKKNFCFTNNKSGKIIQLEKKYHGFLLSLFKNKKIAFLPIFISLSVGILSFLFLDIELLPKIKSDSLSFTIDFPAGTRIETMESFATELTNFFIQSGKGITVSIEGGIEQDDLQRLSLPEMRKERITVNLRNSLNSLIAKQPIQDFFSMYNIKINFIDDQDLLSKVLALPATSYIVTSQNQENLINLAANNPSAKVIPLDNVSELHFIPDRALISRFALNPSFVAQSARGYLEGINSTTFYENGRDIPVVVQLSNRSKLSKNEFENLNIRGENAVIPLRILGQLNNVKSEKTLYRYNRQDGKILYPDSSNNLEEQIDFSEAENIIPLHKIEIKEMLDNGILLLISALLLLYLTMGAQFQSFVIPLLLIIALPPAFSGAILFLVVFQQSLNVQGVIALVVLFGTSVNNSILIYENCILSKIKGLGVIEGSVKKLRSLLVTNLTTVCSLIPFTMNFSGKNSQSSMALCIVGGLIFSTFLVLILMPLIFSVVLQKRSVNE